MKLGHCPAACHVDPEVSSDFSIRIESVQPSSARWYRRPIPMAPPPTIATRACVFTRLGPLQLERDRRSLGVGRGALGSGRRVARGGDLVVAVAAGLVGLDGVVVQPADDDE